MSKKTDLARALAIYAHDGQVDKAGNDYALHPQHIAAQFQDEDRQIVALLHDVLEDTFVQADTIGNLFGAEIQEAVEAMTHGENEPYLDYVRRAAANPISRDVKLADLRHNMDLSRLGTVTEADTERLKNKYLPAYAIITGKEAPTDGD